MRSTKSQSIFDFALALIAVSGLVVGIVRIWIWFNANYAKREMAYQSGRIYAAGHNRPSSYTNPIQIGGNETCHDCNYASLRLTQDWVFRGKYTETLSGVALDSNASSSGSACDTQCKGQCAGQPGCQSPDGDFNVICDCYQLCSSQCYCNNQIQTAVNSYASQVTAICGTDNICDSACADHTGEACSLYDNAVSMREKADECDDPWELCWWGDWGKTPDELRLAATQMDQSADYLIASAKKLQQRSVDLQGCCTKPTKVAQKECLDEVNLATSCDASCFTQSQNNYIQCSRGCDSTGCLGRCKTNADTYNTNCYEPCFNKNSLLCPARVAYIVDSLNAQITSLNDSKTDLETSLGEINAGLANCASSADATCALQCRVYDENHIYYHIDPACYAVCYEPARNSCCRAYPPDSPAWGRDCDTPVTGCDTGGSPGNPPPKCGLSKLTDNLNTQIQNIMTQINKANWLISQLSNCCSYEKVEDQNSCIDNLLSSQ